MSDTPSLSNKIYSFIQTNVAGNCAIFIGSGILVSSYSTTWLNDPTTQSGIAIAGLFNAIALGITNRIAKTDENTSYVFQTVLTVVTLAATIFIAPYLAAALTERYAVVLTTDVAFQNGVLYLGIKAILCLLFIGGSKSFVKEQLTIDQIKGLSIEQLEAKFEYFNTNGNEKAWSDLSEEVQHFFIQAILILEKVKLMQFPTEADEIKVVNKYNKFQASLLRVLVSRGPLVLDPLMSACYAELFFSHDLKPLDQDPNDRYKILPKELPIPTLEDVKKLTCNKMQWYRLLTDNIYVWKSFPLDVQDAYNTKCQEYGINKWLLCPLNEESITNANELTIIKLYDQLLRNGGAVNVTRALHIEVEKRFNEIAAFLDKVPDKVGELTNEELIKLHLVYSLGIPGFGMPIIPKLIEKELSKKFIILELNPPTKIWACDGEIPGAEAFAKFNKLQLRWLAQYFATPDFWNSLDFRSQVTYNNRFIKEIDLWFHVTAKPDVAVIKEEGAISNALALNMMERYIESEGDWKQVEPNAQAAFKALFNKFWLQYQPHLG